MDFDVLDAYNKIFHLDFFGTHESQTLRLVARIEGERISQTPFIFPMVNIFKKMTQNSKFYTYDRGTQKTKSALDSKPFFSEYCIPGTGHPLGYAYGWVWDDPEYLYVYLDVTGDNTRDGNKDYASVHIRTGNGVKTFRISEDQTQYGLSFFQYTDKVTYEHKAYQFKIPKTEAGDEKKSYNLAFSVYGTMAPSPSQMCDIPYNIKGNNWWTGLRIRPLANTSFTIEFFGSKSDLPYETVMKSITSVDGWTGSVDQLLPDPDDFQDPTFLRIYADYRFTVTQFLGKTNGDGFSHQTFYSYPYSVGWPYEDDGPILIK